MSKGQWKIEVNRYSYEGSGFSAVHGTYDTKTEAMACAKVLWETGSQRWVHVVGPTGAIYFMDGVDFPNGDGGK